jgi:hygromycin-B 7''-O-kinase
VGELADQVSQEDWLRIAREMGEMIRRLHALPLQGSPVFPDHLDDYAQFLETQRVRCLANHREWGALPARLIEQIEQYLPAPHILVNRSQPPHLIHADLTEDHLLGRIANGRWETLGLIDFGDAMTGDFLYELSALHLSMFHKDRGLLNVFLDTYGLDRTERAELPHKAMATALLHQFNVLEDLPEEMLHAETLAELANRLWGE